MCTQQSAHMCPGPGLHWSCVMQQGQALPEAFRIHNSCAFELNPVNSVLEPHAIVSVVGEAVWRKTGERDKTVLWMAESSQHRRTGPAGSSGRVNRARTKGANLGNRRDQFLGAKSWRNMWQSLRGKKRGENASSEQAEHFGIRTRWQNLLYGWTILCCGSGL